MRTAQGSASILTYQDALVLLDAENAPAVAATAPQMDAMGQVVYQGANVASQLFADGEDPVGKTIRINNIGFKVIGVLEAKGGSGMGNQDDQVLVPITTAMARLSRTQTSGGASISQISAHATGASQMDAAIQQITAILEGRRNITGTDDFMVQSQEDLVASATEMSDILTIFLGGVAGISLLVGGIGVMNTMLVSVTERTREIGIRKAMGATRVNVFSQFLSEATLLSVVGGLITAPLMSRSSPSALIAIVPWLMVRC